MIKKITSLLSLFFLSGCGLGHALQEAGTGKENYSACVLHHIENHSTHYRTRERAAEQMTAFVISACKREEETYVVLMTNLAMTLTANLVSRDKFLEDEEASLRDDLHVLAASLVEQEL